MDKLESRLKYLTPEQEREILFLELNRLLSRKVIDFKLYEKAKDMWGI